MKKEKGKRSEMKGTSGGEPLPGENPSRFIAETLISNCSGGEIRESPLVYRELELAFAEYQKNRGATLLEFQPVGSRKFVDAKYDGEVLGVSPGEMVFFPEYTAPFTLASIYLAEMLGNAGETEMRFSYSPALCARIEAGVPEFFGQLGLERIELAPASFERSLLEDMYTVKNAEEFLSEIGLSGNTQTYVNDTKPIVGYLERAGLSEIEIEEVLKAIDRGTKINQDVLGKVSREGRLLLNELRDSPDILGSGRRVKALYRNGICDKIMDALPGAVFSPTLVRGLSFYGAYGKNATTVFEIFPKGEPGREGAICGGGRYDGLYNKLAEKFGFPEDPRKYSATGYAFGRERLAELVLKARRISDV